MLCLPSTVLGTGAGNGDQYAAQYVPLDHASYVWRWNVGDSLARPDMYVIEQAVCLSLLADGDLGFVKQTHLAGIVHELLQLLLAVILLGGDPSCA